MKRLLRVTLLSTVCAGATGCGGGAIPTAPTAVATTPVAAPVSLAGTWVWGAAGGPAYMTLTQNGSVLTGTTTRRTTVVSDVQIIDGGTVLGTIEGGSVTLLFTNTIDVSGPGISLHCTIGSTFFGEPAGNALPGTLVAGTSPISCDGDPNLVASYAVPGSRSCTFFKQ